MRRAIVGGVLLLSACASSAPTALDIGAMQRRLDDRGIGFGVTGLPGEKAVLLQVRFKIADANDLSPPVDVAAAAAAAAPEGCTVASLEPAGEGQTKAIYTCRR